MLRPSTSLNTPPKTPLLPDLLRDEISRKHYSIHTRHSHHLWEHAFRLPIECVSRCPQSVLKTQPRVKQIERLRSHMTCHSVVPLTGSFKY